VLGVFFVWVGLWLVRLGCGSSGEGGEGGRLWRGATF